MSVPTPSKQFRVKAMSYPHSYRRRVPSRPSPAGETGAIQPGCGIALRLEALKRSRRAEDQPSNRSRSISRMTTIDFNPQLPILYATIPEAAFAETSEVGDGALLDRGDFKERR
jgi:hypothetical protein